MNKPAAHSRSDHQVRILNAAAKVFLDKGFEEASTAEIARGAGVSKRELYANFRGKRDILSAVITQLQKEVQSDTNLTWSSSGDLRKVLIHAGSQILAFIDSEKFAKLFRIVAAESFHDPASAQKFYLLGPGRGREDTAAFMRRHMAAGKLRKGDALRAADDFLNLLISSRHLTALALGQKSVVPEPGKHVRHAVDMFLSFYGKEPSSSPAARSALKGHGFSRAEKANERV